MDASSVSVHQVEEEVPLVTSDRLLKGVAATGALLGGGVATYVVQADEATSPSAVEHTVSPTTDVLAASDSAVLGHSGAITESAVRGDVVSQSASATDSVSNSVDSVSLSLSASHQASASVSTSLSTQSQPLLVRQLRQVRVSQPAPVLRLHRKLRNLLQFQ